MRKGIQNTDVVAYKLGLISIRATNYRLEIVREKKQKREEIIKRWKIEVKIAKYRKARERINLFSKK